MRSWGQGAAGAERVASEGRRRVLHGLGAVGLVALLPGLAACGSTPPPPQLKDLGGVPSGAGVAPLARPVELVGVFASDVLQGTSIVYRLDALEPFRRQAYRDSRWAAPVPVLVAARLRQVVARAAVAPGGAAVKPVNLTLELEECIQLFAGAGSSTLLLRLSGVTDEGARRAFERTVPAGGDSDGAVRAVAQALDALTPEILGWASSTPVVDIGRGRG